MHAAAFVTLGLDHHYEVADVSATELAKLLATLRDAAYLGANVTAPHKAAVMEHLDEIEPLAERADAVNTIVNQGGRLVGSNSDVPAIVDQVGRLRSAPRNAVILGAGGAARAVAIALAELGAPEPAMVSRATWSQLPTLLADADLVINATPVGTNSDACPIDPALLHDGLAVLDLVYRPSPTRLVHEARSRGLEARAGAGVLLAQGWRSLATWLQIDVSDVVKRAMADALSAELGAGADV